MTTLADALPAEIARVAELKGVYQSLPGGAGAFGAMMMAAALARAQKAIGDGDIVEMIRSYQELKEITG